MAKAKKPAEPAKVGRPIENVWDPEMAAQICEAVATSTLSIAKIIEANPHFPCEQAIRMWRYKIEEFRQMWAEAKRAQAELYVEECMPIVDDNSQDTVVDSNGNTIPNNEFIARSKLRMEMRKWIGVKLVPRLYGDKMQVETNAPPKAAAKTIKERMEKLKENEKPY